MVLRLVRWSLVVVVLLPLSAPCLRRFIVPPVVLSKVRPFELDEWENCHDVVFRLTLLG
jgi:hypothetical protein